LAIGEGVVGPLSEQALSVTSVNRIRLTRMN
jgi:hypothetical protein